MSAKLPRTTRLLRISLHDKNNRPFLQEALTPLPKRGFSPKAGAGKETNKQKSKKGKPQEEFIGNGSVKIINEIKDLK